MLSFGSNRLQSRILLATLVFGFLQSCAHSNVAKNSPATAVIVSARDQAEITRLSQHCNGKPASPTSEKECYRLGVKKDQLGLTASAEQTFQKICTAVPSESSNNSSNSDLPTPTEVRHSWGCLGLGEINERLGNWTMAKNRFTQACRGSVPEGCSRLGKLLIKLGEQDAAVAELQVNCDEKNGEACDVLGSTQTDPDEAKNYFTKSCHLLVGSGCMHEDDSTTHQRESLLDQSCRERHQSEVCEYLSAHSTSANHEERYTWSACTFGSQSACEKLTSNPESKAALPQIFPLLSLDCHQRGDLNQCLSLLNLYLQLNRVGDAETLQESICSRTDIRCGPSDSPLKDAIKMETLTPLWKSTETLQEMPGIRIQRVIR